MQGVWKFSFPNVLSHELTGQKPSLHVLHPTLLLHGRQNPPRIRQRAQLRQAVLQKVPRRIHEPDLQPLQDPPQRRTGPSSGLHGGRQYHTRRHARRREQRGVRAAGGFHAWTGRLPRTGRFRAAGGWIQRGIPGRDESRWVCATGRARRRWGRWRRWRRGFRPWDERRRRPWDDGYAYDGNAHDGGYDGYGRCVICFPFFLSSCLLCECIRHD